MSADGLGRYEPTDEELAGLGGAGLEALFARHHAALYRFCAGFMRQGDEAADVMQTVWERAFVTFSRRRGTVATVRPWLYTVARNECLDAIRARSATRTLDDCDLELAGGVTPEERFEQRAELAQLVDDLADLSKRQREALVLRELAGFEGQQLASALGTSPPRALGLVAEARRGLIERRIGRTMPCTSAQQELTRRHQRSRGVRAHLDSCADCQSFERGRRGRSLSSLAISPPLLLAALAGRISGLVPAAPQGIMKATAATALAAGSIGLGGPVVTPAQPPRKAAIQSSAVTDQRPASVPRRAMPGAQVAARATTSGTRRLPRPSAPRVQARASTPTPLPHPPATPAPPAPAPPRDPPPADVATATRTALPELTARVEAIVDTTLAITEQVTNTLHSTVNSVLTLLPR